MYQLDYIPNLSQSWMVKAFMKWTVWDTTVGTMKMIGFGQNPWDVTVSSVSTATMTAPASRQFGHVILSSELGQKGR